MRNVLNNTVFCGFRFLKFVVAKCSYGTGYSKVRRENEKERSINLRSIFKKRNPVGLTNPTRTVVHDRIKSVRFCTVQKKLLMLDTCVSAV